MKKLHKKKSDFFLSAASFLLIFFILFTALALVNLLPQGLESFIKNPLGDQSLADFISGVPAPFRPLLPTELSVKTPIAPLSTSPSVASPSSFSDDPNAPSYQYGPFGQKEKPRRIIISSVGIDAPVYNPISANNTILDKTLLLGAVRYPLSGLLNENSNVYIFGHSTGYLIVHNQAYRTFSNIQHVKKGDEIIVQGDFYSYHYAIVSLIRVNADDAWIDLSQKQALLTISTCDVFGAKQDRYIVQAKFVKKTDL